MKRIALCDLNHTTVGIHTETMPLGIGLVGSYLKSRLNSDAEIRLYKFPEEFTRDLESGWVPDVFGGAMYSWNSRLDLNFARHVKERSPRTLVLVGGPDIPTLPDEVNQFLTQNDYVDLVVNLDAEIPVLRAVEEVLKGKEAEELKGNPVPGTFSLPPNAEKVLYACMPERLTSLDEVPSPYLNGMFDKFFDVGTLAPMIETNRGCPFTCTFCHQALKYFNKPLWKSLEMIEREIELFARKFAGRHDIRLFITDNNFGTFPRDQEVAAIIRKYQDRYDWPMFIDVTTGKTRPDDIVQTVKKLKYGLHTTASMQTMTEEVLKNIQRKNLGFKDYLRLQRMSKEAGGTTFTEIIQSLPGESKESFLNTIRTIIDAEIDDVVVYTLMNLRGTPLYDQMKMARANGENLLFKYRVVPRQFGRYLGETVLDTEEVVVGTPTMPFEDYVWLRGFALVIQNVYSSKAFPELVHFLRENNVDIMSWLRKIYEDVLKGQGIASRQMAAFLKETRDECFDSEEELRSFFEQDENYAKLLRGELGGNLRSKYVFQALQDGFEDWLNISIRLAHEFLVSSKNPLSDQEAKNVLHDLKTFFSTTRNIVHFFSHDNIVDYLSRRHTLELEYDIPSWIEHKRAASGLPTPLSSLKHSRLVYEVYFSDKLKENITTVNQKEPSKKSVNIYYILNAYSRHYWPELRQLAVA